MRTPMLTLFAIVIISVAVPAQACQACADYFDPQVLGWCSYCVESRCGFFQCNITQLGSFDVCGGDDGCFEYGGHCPDEPQPLAVAEGTLAEKWKLTSVRVAPPKAANEGAPVRE